MENDGLLMNNAPRWLARAAAVVNGTVQTEISPVVVPTIDVMQDGWGLAKFTNVIMLNNGLAQTLRVCGDSANLELGLTQHHLVRFSVQNNDAIGVVCEAYQLSRLGAWLLYEFGETVPAGTTRSTSYCMGGRDWIYIAPGNELWFAQSAGALNAGRMSALVVSAPAGTKLL